MSPRPEDLRHRLLPIVLGQAVGIACGLAGVRLISHLVPPAVLGNYGVFLTFTTLGMWVVHSGIIKFTGRHWAAAPDRRVLVAEVIALWFRKLGWLALAAAAAAWLTSRLTTIPPWKAFVPLLLSSSFLSITALGQAALQAERRHWPDLAISTAGSLGRTFLPPVGFLLAGGTAAGLYAGFGVHALATAALAAWCLRKHWLPGAQGGPGDLKIEAVYTGPLFTVLAMAGWLLAGLNRWAAAWGFGDEAAGQFTLASNLALIVPSVLGAVFLQFLQPGLYALGDAADAVARQRLARRVDLSALAFLVAGLAALGAIRMISPWLVGPLISEKYRPALEWILPAGAFGLATAIAGLYHTMLLAARREHACGPVELGLAAALVTGSLVSAGLGQVWFWWWLVLTPVLPWILSRPAARYHLFNRAGARVPAAGR